jgi:hypothetical protein
MPVCNLAPCISWGVARRRPGFGGVLVAADTFRDSRALQERGHEIIWIPEGDDMDLNRGLNFVTLGPRKVLMVAGYPTVQRVLEAAGAACVAVDCSEPRLPERLGALPARLSGSWLANGDEPASSDKHRRMKRTGTHR